MIARIPQVVAHRGASQSRPENTAAAFDEALAQGCDGIELDLQITRDDEVVVFHDKTLSMLGLKHRRIGQYRRAELEALDVGSWFAPEFAGQRILDLDEVLDRYAPRTDLYLEIKPVGESRRPERVRRLAERVAGRVSAHPQAHRVYLLSFSDTALAVAGDHNSALRLVHNFDSPDQLRRLPEADLARLYGVCVDIRRFTMADVARAHAAARQVFTYTADSPRHLRMALELEVAAVISNRPQRTRRLLESFIISG